MSAWTGARVHWRRHLSEVPVDPDIPAIYVLHEFLDALPVHQFQRTKDGWREVMIEADDDPAAALHFRRVLAPKPSPASYLLAERRLKWLAPGDRDRLAAMEVSAQSLSYAQELAARVGRHRGAALIVDYGKDGPYEASVQGIRNHEGVSVLSQPGSADLSAWVDFAALRSAIGEVPMEGPAVVVEGPVSQGQFLTSLGIGHRLEQLVARASDAQAQALVEGCRRLVEGSLDGAYTPQHSGDTAGGEREGVGGMGQAYQALAILSADVHAHAAVGGVAEPEPAAGGRSSSPGPSDSSGSGIPGFS